MRGPASRPEKWVFEKDEESERFDMGEWAAVPLDRGPRQS